MTAGGDIIFLVGEDKKLIAMKNQRYESEDILQTIVEDYPEILAGGDDTDERRLALVKREQSVAGELGGASRWSLDHLFLDQSGVPTLVEVKRSTDTRIRREVVGQMLDYAANGVKYWPVDDLREQFAVTHSPREPDSALQDLLGVTDAEAFWRSVQDNLAAGRIRMVFLADQIPSELQRIIEFLNEQMSRAEVLGVEVKQYVAGDRKTLVPRVLGSTAQAQQAKRVGPRKTYAEHLSEAPDYVVNVARKLIEWAERNGHQTVSKPVSMGIQTVSRASLFTLYPAQDWRVVEMYLSTLRQNGLESEADLILEKANRAIGKTLTPRTPTLPCESLLANWSKFEDEVFPLYVRYAEEAHRRGTLGN